MPIFNFYGTNEEVVKKFAAKSSELALNLNAPEQAFSFWNITSISTNTNLVKIEIKWKKREEAMKAWVSDLLQNFFTQIDSKKETVVIFSEIDDNYYKSGKKS
ncbi:hypothetical protein SSABA_v1c00160 [Spiroplasma sabaudiense Ar-1343]|uniref:ABM domain-containing protein n=1 Tax=Spiroplasma sabaudiense Ar-1343 TaxID=1276257 RepID=W6A8D6_9MOLU|nr:DUF1904 family protein [Spiroplasma sabaudiense]AHI53428.1 hypothetical protein SSABA_v1c00160 [Spiroplasma sabaudiense Ar-1343]